MAITSKKEALLDDKQCLDLWIELGSTEKVSKHLANNGQVNPTTKKPFSQMAIWDAAFRWILSHPEEAREIYVEQGSVLTQEEWEEWLVGRARHVLGTSKGRFLAWIERNNFQKYEYVYAERFGIEQEESN